MNSGFTTPPQIDTADYNGLKLESSSTSVGNFVVLQKPNIITDGLVFHMDVGDKDSYPGTGTTIYDLSKNGYDATMVGGLASGDISDGWLQLPNADQATEYVSIPNSALNGLTS